MKKASLFLLLGLFAFTGYSQSKKNEIKWMTWEQAIEANRKAPKKIFVDLYTSWCGWCKVMDQKTFSDSTVAAYMNTYFYPVKFDAESKTPVRYNDYEFVFKPEYKSHELAVSLLNGQMSYPSFVVLTEKEERLTILKGYQEKEAFLKNLKSILGITD